MREFIDVGVDKTLIIQITARARKTGGERRHSIEVEEYECMIFWRRGKIRGFF